MLYWTGWLRGGVRPPRGERGVEVQRLPREHPDTALPGRASNEPTRSCIITEEDPTRAFFWLKVATNAFTFKNL